jgi:hypothetical protein
MQENMKFGMEGSFCGFSYRKNAPEGLLRVIFRSYAAGGPYRVAGPPDRAGAA